MAWIKAAKDVLGNFAGKRSWCFKSLQGEAKTARPHQEKKLLALSPLNVSTDSVRSNTKNEVRSHRALKTWRAALCLATSKTNIISCNTAISSCTQGRNWQLSLWLFATMPEMALSPNETRVRPWLECKASTWRSMPALLLGSGS